MFGESRAALLHSGQEERCCGGGINAAALSADNEDGILSGAGFAGLQPARKGLSKLSPVQIRVFAPLAQLFEDGCRAAALLPGAGLYERRADPSNREQGHQERGELPQRKRHPSHG